MIHLFCFAAKNDIMSLFSRVWFKFHFPLKSPVIYYFQIFIEIIWRCLSVMYNRKQRSIICKQIYIGSEAFCKIINENQNQQRTKDGTLRYSSIDIFFMQRLVRWGLHVVFFPLKNPPEGLVNFQIFHFELLSRWYHHATPYQILLIYQGRRF